MGSPLVVAVQGFLTVSAESGLRMDGTGGFLMGEAAGGEKKGNRSVLCDLIHLERHTAGCFRKQQTHEEHQRTPKAVLLCRFPSEALVRSLVPRPAGWHFGIRESQGLEILHFGRSFPVAGRRLQLGWFLSKEAVGPER